MQRGRRQIGAHALEGNSTGFWTRFLGSKLKRREPSEGTVRPDVLGFDSLRVYHFFSLLDPDHYLCWFLQVLESQVLHDEIMYVFCHLRVLEPPVFASLHRV